MNLALLITNIILVVFTGIYVLLTYRLSKESSNNNKINLDFYKEQIRLACMPIIVVNIPKQKNEYEVDINIENISNLPAFEVDIWILSTVSNDDFPRNILAKIAKGKENKKLLKSIHKPDLADGDFYALYDRGFYVMLQGNSRIKLNSKFAFMHYSIDLLIQYKDHIGNNYYQRYCLAYGEGKNYKLIIEDINPGAFKTHDRFELIKPHFNETTKSFEINRDDKMPQEIEYLYQLVKAGFGADILTEEERSGIESKREIEEIKK